MNIIQGQASKVALELQQFPFEGLKDYCIAVLLFYVAMCCDLKLYSSFLSQLST